MLVQRFAVNSDNELTTGTNGGRLTVMGTAPYPANNVIVNGSNTLLYGDGTFAATNMPLTTSHTAIASDTYGRYATNTVTVNLATNTSFQYDANGNLTNDGWRSFTYDDENELIQVWVANQWLSQFSYDGKMRRRIRQEFTWQSSSWIQTNAVYYVYDGNLVIQERNTNNLPVNTYTRGKDLSGGLQRAGGIGGLLACSPSSATDSSRLTPNFYHADGNGNVTILINSAQAIVAKYLYDPFGNILSRSGSFANSNHYGFSSMEYFQNAGIVGYLGRCYDPILQRWLNRDPSGERGGLNLFEAFFNSSVSFVDRNGRDNIGNMAAGNNAPPSMTISEPLVGGSWTIQFNGGGLGDPFLGMMGAMAAVGAIGAADLFGDEIAAAARLAKKLSRDKPSGPASCPTSAGGAPWNKSLTQEQMQTLQDAMAKSVDEKFKTGGFNAAMYEIMIEQGATPEEAYGATFGRLNN